MSLVLTEPQKVSDFLKWEVDSRFCRQKYKVKNTTGSALTAGQIEPGGLFKIVGANMEPALTADGNTVDGILVSVEAIPALANGATSAAYFSFLVRGPALVNPDAFPADDTEGDAYVLATVITQLATLGIQVLREPTIQGTQTS